MRGMYGNDTYIFGRTSGQDTIHENDLAGPNTSLSDQVLFTSDVLTSDILFARSGNNLVLTIAGTTDQLTITDQFVTTKINSNSEDRIESFVFADKTVWTAADIDKAVIQSYTTTGNDTVLGYDSDDEFGASAGNDSLRASPATISTNSAVAPAKTR